MGGRPFDTDGKRQKAIVVPVLPSALDELMDSPSPLAEFDRFGNRRSWVPAPAAAVVFPARDAAFAEAIAAATRTLPASARGVFLGMRRLLMLSGAPR